jgi:branched-chain amino acid transport system substrate-binding protein
MCRKTRLSWIVLLWILAPVAPVHAQSEQFIPVLVYRTGVYAVSGVPFADGEVDYYKLINEKDGGINGVKIAFEECETGYATDRGLECYERLKGKGPTGAGFVVPRSTGLTFVLTDKANTDKIPLLTPGFGRAASKNGSVFMWNFPLLGTYWSAADSIIQHIGKELGGLERLKGKKISLLFHDSPYGKEPIPALLALARKYDFEFSSVPVPHPGLEQETQWRRIREDKVDYVLLWGWGVMNSAAIKTAATVGYPRDKMIGIWWSGSEADVRAAGDDAIGYKAVALQYGAGKFQVHRDIERYVYAKGKGSGKPEEIGQALYNIGLIGAVLGIEAIRNAQEKFGKKPLTGEQVHWGLEHLHLNEARLKELGLEGMMLPVQVTCADHEGARSARIQQWDGKAWKAISGWYTADETVVEPIVKEVSAKYAAERKITTRECSMENR